MTATPHTGAVHARQRPESPALMRIGDAARLVGVSASALRRWEREGLVTPARTSGRYRLYSADDLEQLRRVRRLRQVDRVNVPGIRHLLHEARAPRRNDRDADPARLRELRQRRSLSLRQASGRSGLSVSYISAIERGASGASLAALQRLVAAYGATMLDLFEQRPRAGRVVRPGERPVLTVEESGVRIEQLARGGTLLEPQLFTLAPGASSDGAYAHAGEEFLYVLDGAVTLSIGDDEEHALTTGDALSFPSTLPHRWRNDAAGETRLLWINTPPTF